MGDKMLPATGEVIAKRLRANTRLHIKTKQLNVVVGQRYHARSTAALQPLSGKRKTRWAGFPVSVSKTSAVKQHSYLSTAALFALFLNKKVDDLKQLIIALQVLTQDGVLTIYRECGDAGNF